MNAVFVAASSEFTVVPSVIGETLGFLLPSLLASAAAASRTRFIPSSASSSPLVSSVGKCFAALAKGLPCSGCAKTKDTLGGAAALLLCVPSDRMDGGRRRGSRDVDE
jgi:hypothetical protein